MPEIHMLSPESVYIHVQCLLNITRLSEQIENARQVGSLRSPPMLDSSSIQHSKGKGYKYDTNVA